jgi:hypothetical protein
MNEFCDTQENIVLTDCLAQGKILYDSRIRMYWFSPPKKHFFRKETIMKLKIIGSCILRLIFSTLPHLKNSKGYLSINSNISFIRPSNIFVIEA